MTNIHISFKRQNQNCDRVERENESYKKATNEIHNMCNLTNKRLKKKDKLCHDNMDLEIEVEREGRVGIPTMNEAHT